jgi:hypothetical protein
MKLKKGWVMNRIKKCLLLLIIFSFSTELCATVKYNQINKVYHHTSHAKGPHLELGSLVFYFAQEPHVTLLTSHSIANGLKEDVFLFEKTKADYQVIQKINQVRNGYVAKFERTPRNNDLKLIVHYDPKKIGMTHDTFDSIGLQKGLVINFFNKELLEKIRKHPKPILQIAALQHISKKKRLS